MAGAAGAAGAAGPNKPHSVVFPHGKKNKETNKVEPCDPIEKVSERARKCFLLNSALRYICE